MKVPKGNLFLSSSLSKKKVQRLHYTSYSHNIVLLHAFSRTHYFPPLLYLVPLCGSYNSTKK